MWQSWRIQNSLSPPPRWTTGWCSWLWKLPSLSFVYGCVCFVKRLFQDYVIYFPLYWKCGHGFSVCISLFFVIHVHSLLCVKCILGKPLEFADKLQEEDEQHQFLDSTSLNRPENKSVFCFLLLFRDLSSLKDLTWMVLLMYPTNVRYMKVINSL